MHVIGTAGHVDHGKSTLVQALTGIDPDRLAEEKAREMTIDLGFAWLTIDDEEIGVVDVPGHRDFIENMLAGVGGIDLALFVIAADEGVMPQTREHLSIIDLLNITHGIIVLTKCDLIDDPNWLELVILEVAEVLQGTVLENAPIVPVSARTGYGIEELKKAIAHQLSAIGPSPDWGRPRLPIDRVFSLPGFGTVVTGTLIDGSFRVGEDVEVQPGGLTGRIRGLQTHKIQRDTVPPGSRVAINITGIDRELLSRGKVVSRKNIIKGSQLLDTLYHHLPDQTTPLLHNSDVKLFVGSAEVSARTRVIGGDDIPPGGEGWLQLALSAPVAVTRGDRFILRQPSPAATIGGGKILDPNPGRRHRRLRPEIAERFQTLSQGTPEDLILNTLINLGPVTRSILLDKSGLTRQDAERALKGLLDEGQVTDLEKVIVTTPYWQALIERVPLEIESYHLEFPMRVGIDREELRSRLKVAPAVFIPLLEHMASIGRILLSGTLLSSTTHEVKFSPKQESSIASLMEEFRKKGVLSPSVKDCKAILDEPLYFALIDLGRMKQINDEVVYSKEVYDELVARLTEYLNLHGSISAPEARDLLGASRKYAIALLEHMDELRITRRSGDIRLPSRPIPT